MAVSDRYNLIKNGTTGVDELVDKILSTSETPEQQAYIKASELRQRPTKKRYIESCLIATNDVEKIAHILGIPPQIIDVYAKVFYDIADFDNLDRLELLDVPDREEAMLKTWALSQGLDFVAWRLGGVVNVDPVEGLSELFTLSTFKSKEALFSGNSSDSSKEAVKWVKTSMDLARLIKAWVLDGDSARKDIELALKEVVPDFAGLDDIKDDLGFDLSIITSEVKLTGLPSSNSD